MDDAHSSAGAARKVVGRPFPKGVSGNPGGRARGLAAYVKSKVGDNGEQLVDALYAIAFGDAVARQDVFGEMMAPPKLRDRQQAISELMDRGFGKSVQSVDVEATVSPYADDTEEQLQARLEELQAAQEAATGDWEA